MSNVVDIEPEYPDVQVYLDNQPDALAVVETVTDALDRAGHPLIAEAFSQAAMACESDAELMLLIRCLVTVI